MLLANSSGCCGSVGAAERVEGPPGGGVKDHTHIHTQYTCPASAAAAASLSACKQLVPQ